MNETIILTRRERRIATRKHQILEAAAKLFAEKGYHRATTKEIAEVADVSEGTIYNYFESKDELLLGIMAHLAEHLQLEDMLDQSLPEDPREFILGILRYRQSFLFNYYDMLRAVLSEILVNPVLAERYYRELILPDQRLLEVHIQKRIEQGQIRPVDVPSAARIVLAILSGIFLLQVLGDAEIQSGWDRLAQELVNIIFHGISLE